MGTVVSESTIVPSAIAVASVERLQGYLGLLDAILGVCRQAEREGETQSRVCCKAMLANCREHFCGHLKRMDQTDQTEWEVGFSYLIEILWETINPMPHVSGDELIGRVLKARCIAGALEKMLSPIIVLESLSPADVEEALERLYADDGYVPF